jgi:hypothetical protein
LLSWLGRGGQKFSMFWAGISGLAWVVAVVMFVFNAKHGAAQYGDMTVRRWLWEAPAIAVGAWLIGFTLLPRLLFDGGLMVVSPQDRSMLAGEMDESQVTGVPMRSLGELKAELDRFQAGVPLPERDTRPAGRI